METLGRILGSLGFQNKRFGCPPMHGVGVEIFSFLIGSGWRRKHEESNFECGFWL